MCCLKIWHLKLEYLFYFTSTSLLFYFRFLFHQIFLQVKLLVIFKSWKVSYLMKPDGSGFVCFYRLFINSTYFICCCVIDVVSPIRSRQSSNNDLNKNSLCKTNKSNRPRKRLLTHFILLNNLLVINEVVKRNWEIPHSITPFFPIIHFN